MTSALAELQRLCLRLAELDEYQEGGFESYEDHGMLDVEISEERKRVLARIRELQQP